MTYTCVTSEAITIFACSQFCRSCILHSRTNDNVFGAPEQIFFRDAPKRRSEYNLVSIAIRRTSCAYVTCNIIHYRSVCVCVCVCSITCIHPFSCYSFTPQPQPSHPSSAARLISRPVEGDNNCDYGLIYNTI